MISNRYKLITNVRSSLMAVNIHITIIELNALHTKRQNLFQELDAVIHLLMEAKHWENAKREMRLRLGKVTVADVLAAQPVTTNLLKFMRASIKMIGVSNLQSFIASMTQKLTLSDISDESKNYLDKAGITTACLRIKSKWTAGGK